MVYLSSYTFLSSECKFLCNGWDHVTHGPLCMPGIMHRYKNGVFTFELKAQALP